MDNFYEQLAEILEVDEVVDGDVLSNFECWDSLTVLSIIAFLDQNYKIKKSALEISSCKNVGDLFKFTIS